MFLWLLWDIISLKYFTSYYLYIYIKCFLKHLKQWDIIFKGKVYPKMKMTPLFIHPQAILNVYMIISDDHNQSYIKKCPWSFKLYNGSEWVL